MTKKGLIHYLTDSEALAGHHHAPHLVKILLHRDPTASTPIHWHAETIRAVQTQQAPITWPHLRQWHRTLLGPHSLRAGALRYERPPRWPWPLPSIHTLHHDLIALLQQLQTDLPALRLASPDTRTSVAWWYHHQLLWLLPFQEGNGRLARLFLNAIRQATGLPWITISARDQSDYEQAIRDYADHRETAQPCCLRSTLLHPVHEPHSTELACTRPDPPLVQNTP